MAENNKDLDMPCKHKNYTGLKHIGLKLEVKTARVMLGLHYVPGSHGSHGTKM